MTATNLLWYLVWWNFRTSCTLITDHFNYMFSLPYSRSSWLALLCEKEVRRIDSENGNEEWEMTIKIDKYARSNHARNRHSSTFLCLINVSHVKNHTLSAAMTSLLMMNWVLFALFSWGCCCFCVFIHILVHYVSRHFSYYSSVALLKIIELRAHYSKSYTRRSIATSDVISHTMNCNRINYGVRYIPKFDCVQMGEKRKCFVKCDGLQ